MQLYQQTANHLHALLSTRQTSATEIVSSVFSQIDRMDKSLKAYITPTRELALQQASAVDQKIANGEAIALLAGIPGALKGQYLP